MNVAPRGRSVAVVQGRLDARSAPELCAHETAAIAAGDGSQLLEPSGQIIALTRIESFLRLVTTQEERRATTAA